MTRILWWKLQKHIKHFSKENRLYRNFCWIPLLNSLLKALFGQISGENVRKLGDGNGVISNEREEFEAAPAREGVCGDRNQYGLQ